jgi:hypothetical protein
MIGHGSKITLQDLKEYQEIAVEMRSGLAEFRQEIDSIQELDLPEDVRNRIKIHLVGMANGFESVAAHIEAIGREFPR